MGSLRDMRGSWDGKHYLGSALIRQDPRLRAEGNF